MFTGIVQEKGPVVFLERGDVMLYAVDFPHEGLKIGASVSINGVCQTVVSVDGAVFFEAIEETLRCTTLGDLMVGDEVNIERSARIGDEIGGHLLSGHIMTTATISHIKDNAFTFGLKDTRYLFRKGFVAIDGMSLTVVDVFEGGFSVHLIPETERFFRKGLGERVNVEFDATTVACVDTVSRLIPNTGNNTVCRK